MALTPEEKADVRRYMGYPNVGLAGSISLGVPAASQPLFIVESAMNRILPEAEEMVREYLTELRCIDEQVKQARKRRLKVSKVAKIEIRGPEELDTLYEEYDMWVSRLSDLLAAPINPYSEIFDRIHGSNAISVPR